METMSIQDEAGGHESNRWRVKPSSKPPIGGLFAQTVIAQKHIG
jgi:hypothetical protein